MNNLRNIRKERGLSIKQLHELTGYPVRTLEDWDSNKRPLQVYHRMKKLAEILNCDIDYLMTLQVDCLYQGIESTICMQQEEDGIYTMIVNDDDYEAVVTVTIEKPVALDILEHLKTDKEVAEFFK